MQLAVVKGRSRTWHNWHCAPLSHFAEVKSKRWSVALRTSRPITDLAQCPDQPRHYVFSIPKIDEFR